MKHLLIAGHGRNLDGSFDSGATGFIKKGEHHYMKENLFKAMEKKMQAGEDLYFFTAYSVYSHGNLLELAQSYGPNLTVTEFHFDGAQSPQARGGHVIIHRNFQPDALDLRLRDAIESMVGVRYSHRGHRGFSGRSDLLNVNLAARGRLNYRLVELGFGSSPIDSKILLDSCDNYADKLLQAYYPNRRASKRRLFLPKNLEALPVYQTGPCLVGKEIGKIYPKKFQGLSYDILDEVLPGAYKVQTRDYGQVILVPGDQGHIHEV